VRSAERLRDRQVRVARAPQTGAVDDSGRLAQAVASAGRRGARITWRLVAVLVVFAVLVVTYANSLRVYYSQQRQIADTKAQVAAAQQTVDDLHAELDRWQDPAYVKAQARERLGWVMPGEIGFHIIGTDGQMLGGGATISQAAAQPDSGQPGSWYARLADSILTADDPVPVPQTVPQVPATVTPPR